MALPVPQHEAPVHYPPSPLLELEKRGWIRIVRNERGGFVGACFTPLGVAGVKWGQASVTSGEDE